ncbi:MAG: 5-formyltetrahydrofolate cyclo-ligase YgfA [Roseibaca calidilacus]|uniref:5-formyltetrahydrofolate cyclo-ligase n=1 Tax=Roseibaca calidilacus TaxID=1666912 RepID=A0A0P7WHB1_9RHOB|nr:5-formyltetrahydrofolate cyclo-ligase [Roseibaca calidilacus]KPP89870.1 MAG: 5-formyltetrahydrofolate cyclo-ligase YgfA [Roseibaca calidilacus]CUX80908.1 5-formyltetrahydrofolate cyclo-ligase [Roseibaca calidilacus]
MNKAAHRDAAAKRRAVAHVAGGAQAAQRACAVISDILVARFGAQLGQVVLAGYMPMRSEISPLPAMLAHPGPVCVPVITARATPLEFHRWSAQTPMQRGQFGADIPVTADLLVPDVLIAPLLAYDPRGYRLGYGGGFYDRTLAQLRARGPVLAIGLAYGAQSQPEVPIEQTDEPLDLIATEEGLVTVPGRAEPGSLC